MPRFAEPVLNVKLAEILSEYGLEANPEILDDGPGETPDVRIIVGGLKVILEGKLEIRKEKLKRQTKERLTGGLADISIGLLYEEGLNEAQNPDKLRDNMITASYDGWIYYWGDDGVNIHEFQGLTIDLLAEQINRIYGLYFENNLLQDNIDAINSKIGALAGEGSQVSLFFRGGAVEARLKEVLGLEEEE